jgi:hypothetical protein
MHRIAQSILAILGYVGFCFGRNVHSLLQMHVWWRITGTKRELEFAKTVNLAHVFNIVRRQTLVELMSRGVNDFILTHSSFTDLKIIQQDNVTLYDIDEHKAVFVETDKDFCVWKSDSGSFLIPTQFQNARRVIVVYRESFESLSELLSFGSIKRKLVFISALSRSGSTLLLQIFEHTNRCISFNEPEVLTSLSKNWSSDTMPRDTADKLAEYAINFLCKPTNLLQDQAEVFYAIKPGGTNMKMILGLRRVFEDSAHLYLYRSVMQTAPSNYKLGMSFTNIALFTAFPRVILFLIRKVSKLELDGNAIRSTHPYVLFVLVWAQLLLHFKRLREQGFDIAGVLYEDLITNKRATVTTIFTYCGLPESFVDDAMQAFEKDSQEKSTLSRSALAKIRAPDFTADFIGACNDYCDAIGLPHVDEDHRV